MTEDHPAPEGAGRREVSAELLAGRAARELVRPIQEKLGPWQAEAIKLEVKARRIRSSGRDDPAANESARTLHGFVVRQAAEFEQAVQGAPATIQAHGRVADVRAVLKLLEERLTQTMRSLGEGPK